MPASIFVRDATLKLIQSALENGIITRQELLDRLAETKDGEFRWERMVWTDPYAKKEEKEA